MGSSVVFQVRDIFFLEDGKVVFAGNYSEGLKQFGVYILTVAGQPMQKITIAGEMHFPSKGTEDIALYSTDLVERHLADVSKGVRLLVA